MPEWTFAVLVVSVNVGLSLTFSTDIVRTTLSTFISPSLTL